jgi:hypothetical protein
MSVRKPKDLETTMTCHLKDLIEGKIIREVLLEGHDIPMDKEVLESIELHKIIIPSVGADPDIPFKFNINGKFI